jgi:hypothetical protein
VMFSLWEASQGGRVVTSLEKWKWFSREYLSWQWSAWIWDPCISFPKPFQREKWFSVNPVWKRNLTMLHLD